MILFDTDPQTSGLLGMAAALLQAGGPSRTPVSFGQALGSSYLAGQGAAQRARLLQQQEQMSQLQQMLIATQMSEAARKAREDATLKEIFRGAYGPQERTTNVPITLGLGDMDPTLRETAAPEELARHEQGIATTTPVTTRTPGFDVQKATHQLLAAGRPDLVKQLGEADAAFAPKLKTEEIFNPSTGARQKVVIDERTGAIVRELGGAQRDRVTVGNRVIDFGGGSPQEVYAAPAKLSAPQVVMQNGAPILAAFNEETGQMVPVPGVQPKPVIREINDNKTIRLIDEISGREYGRFAVDISPADQQRLRNEAQRLALASRADARDAERLSREGFEIKEGNDGNFYYVPKAPGATAQPVQSASGPLVGKGATLTEGQANSTMFALRARDSLATINALESGDTFGRANVAEGTRNAVGGIPVIGGALSTVAGTAGGAVTSEAQQSYGQAKRDFISAVLRKESGAVISDSEYKNEDIKYFPQPGDSDVVIGQKRRSRENALRGLEIGAGPGMRQAPERPAPAAAPDLLQRFRDAQKQRGF